MDFINGYALSILEWVLVAVAAFMVGFSKTGIGGVAMLAIPILAGIFGGKESTGILLPMLIAGDIFAIAYYHRHAEWSKIIRVLPWTFAGLALGIAVGNLINDKQFIMLIAILVLICLGMLIYMEKKGSDLKLPEGAWFYIAVGIVAGFASMIGNAAGPIFTIYLLSMGFRKNDFIGTSAWFFFIINMTKLPMQVFFWHNITLRTAVIAVCLIPIIAAGAFLGVAVVKKINEKIFRYIILVMTALTAIKLFF